MNEIIEYCGSKKGTGINPGLVVMLSGLSLALIALICFHKNMLAASCTAFFIAVFTLMFTMWFWKPSQNRITIQIKKFEREGILNDVIDDFKQSKPHYSDSLRLGKKYIFGKHSGVIAEIAEIYTIGRVLNYLENKSNNPWFTINYLTKAMYSTSKSTRMLPIGGIVICTIDMNDNTDENWYNLCDELVIRNNVVKYDRREFAHMIRTPNEKD